MTGWDALQRELELWRAGDRQAAIWWRDDDAVRPGPALDRLLELSSRHDVPLALAVIPAAAEAPLAQRLAGRAGDEPAVTAGREVGLAWALAGLARAIPAHARQKRLYLPADLCRDAGLKVGELFELRSSAALTQVVAGIAARAGEHLRAARALRGRVPRSALPALLPATLAGYYLRTLKRAGYDPFHPKVQSLSGTRAWRLLLANLTGRY